MAIYLNRKGIKKKKKKNCLWDSNIILEIVQKSYLQKAMYHLEKEGEIEMEILEKQKTLSYC